MEGTRPSVIAGILLLALFLSLALTLPWQVPAAPRGEEATFLMMVESLWHDRDLRYEARDLSRAYQHWDDGPVGLRLGEGAGEGWFYALPVVPALAALPFYAVFGPAGLRVLGVVLLGVIFLAAVWLARRRLGHGSGFIALLLFASALPACALRLESTLVTAACAFLPLVLWLELRRLPESSERGWHLSERGWHLPSRLGIAAVAGILLGAAFTMEPLLLLLALPPVLDFFPSRHRRAMTVLRVKLLVSLLVGLLITVGLVGALQRKGTGEWRPAEPERSTVRTFHGPFPLEAQFQPSPPPPRQATSWNAGAAVLPANLGYFWVGRYTGVLPYFPCALLALFLFLGRKEARWRPGWSLLGAVLAYVVLLLLRSPESYHGGVGAFGNRGFAVLYPVLLLIPAAWPGLTRTDRVPRILTALAGLAALVWTVPAVVSSWSAPGTDAQRHVRTVAFQALPLELPLATRGALEDYWVRAGRDALWLLPRHAFFAEEANPRGVWMRGATSAEVLVITPVPRETLSLPVQSVSADNVFTATSAAGTVQVRFDTADKRRGTPLTLPLGSGTAVSPGDGTVEAGQVYRLRLRSSHGLVPRRWDRKNGDARYLGTFLAFGDAP